MIKELGLAAAFAIGTAGVASASMLFTVTEGNGNNRALIAGSTALSDAPPGGAGINLNTVTGTTEFSGDDVIGIYGRIVSSTDVFTADFSFAEGFNVTFDLDGYDFIDGGGATQFEANSGLVGQPLPAGGPPVPGTFTKSVDFSLTDGITTQTRTFTTDILASLGSDDFIFTAGPGDYTLSISGTTDDPALYDLQIAAVPVPFAGLMLVGALGGLAAYRRRQTA